MRISGTMFAAALVLMSTACSSEGDDAPNPNSEIKWIACAETGDCVQRGGTCLNTVCRADNECASDTDCAEGSCVADSNFGGLCTVASEGPPVPGPAWPCASGSDCPIGQGCSSDGLCHEDGECTTTTDCAAAEICYNAGNDDPAGFCAAERPATNPYCRSDGAGACRYECNSDGSCVVGATCGADNLCHYDDECDTVADCSPNHLCAAWEDFGYNVCVEDENPTCVTAPDGVCRLACWTDGDCLAGGGCDSDGFCHASNECSTDSDCDTGLTCQAVDLFGKLCGPERP